MRPTVIILAFLGLIGLGSWAYRENYSTQSKLRDVTALQEEIVQLREALTVQRAEWAYLNRPDRLRELVTLNSDRLGLLPMEPSQFGAAADIVYPAPDAGFSPAVPDLGASAQMPALSAPLAPERQP